MWREMNGDDMNSKNPSKPTASESAFDAIARKMARGVREADLTDQGAQAHLAAAMAPIGASAGFVVSSHVGCEFRWKADGDEVAALLRELRGFALVQEALRQEIRAVDVSSPQAAAILCRGSSWRVEAMARDAPVAGQKFFVWTFRTDPEKFVLRGEGPSLSDALSAIESATQSADFERMLPPVIESPGNGGDGGKTL